MADVTMSIEEYLALIQAMQEQMPMPQLAGTAPGPGPGPKKRKGKKNPKLKKAVTEANKRLRTKSGKLRKGKTQADVMRLAHRLMKKMK